MKKFIYKKLNKWFNLKKIGNFRIYIGEEGVFISRCPQRLIDKVIEARQK